MSGRYIRCWSNTVTLVGSLAAYVWNSLYCIPGSNSGVQGFTEILCCSYIQRALRATWSIRSATRVCSVPLGIYDSAVADLKQVCTFWADFVPLFLHVKTQRGYWCFVHVKLRFRQFLLYLQKQSNWTSIYTMTRCLILFLEGHNNEVNKFPSHPVRSPC